MKEKTLIYAIEEGDDDHLVFYRNSWDVPDGQKRYVYQVIEITEEL